MMKQKLVSLAMMGMLSCTPTYKATVKVTNATGQKVTPLLYIRHDLGNLGGQENDDPIDDNNNVAIEAGKTAELHANKIKAGDYLVLKGQLEHGGVIGPRTIRVDDDVDQWKPRLVMPDSKVETLTAIDAVQKQLEYDPTKFRVREQLPLVQLYNGFLGGLVFYTDTVVQTKDTLSIKKIIQPIQLGTHVDFVSSGTTKRLYTSFTTDSKNQAALTLPGIGQLTSKLTNASLYKVEIIYRNPGTVAWVATSGMKTVEELFASLPKAVLTEIGGLYMLYPNLKVSQINYAYAVEAISYTAQNYKQIDEGASVDAYSIVQGGQNYVTTTDNQESDILGSVSMGSWWQDNEYATFLPFAKKFYLASLADSVASNPATSATLATSLKKEHIALPESLTPDDLAKALNKLQQQVPLTESLKTAFDLRRSKGDVK